VLAGNGNSASHRQTFENSFKRGEYFLQNSILNFAIRLS